MLALVTIAVPQPPTLVPRTLYPPSGPHSHSFPPTKQAFTGPTALKPLKPRHMGGPSSPLWEARCWGWPGLRWVLPQPLPERSPVSGEWAGTGQVPCSAAVVPAQEGAATELRSINKASGRNGFNLHFTYWCLLCYFQYGNLILLGAWLWGHLGCAVT